MAIALDSIVLLDEMALSDTKAYVNSVFMDLRPLREETTRPCSGKKKIFDEPGFKLTGTYLYNPANYKSDIELCLL